VDVGGVVVVVRRRVEVVASAFADEFVVAGA
jgi:hypothetical protein